MGYEIHGSLGLCLQSNHNFTVSPILDSESNAIIWSGKTDAEFASK